MVVRSLEMFWPVLSCLWKSDENEWLDVFWWNYQVTVNFPLILIFLGFTENHKPCLGVLIFKQTWGIRELYSFTVTFLVYACPVLCCFSKERVLSNHMALSIVPHLVEKFRCSWGFTNHALSLVEHLTIPCDFASMLVPSTATGLLYGMVWVGGEL